MTIRTIAGQLARVATGALFAVSAGAFVWEWVAVSATEHFFRRSRTRHHGAPDDRHACPPSDGHAGYADGHVGYAADAMLLPASVLVPLKGGTAANERSIRSLLSQDYPEFDVTVGTDEADTEAQALVRRLQQECGQAVAEDRAASARPRPPLHLAAGPNRLGGRPKVGNLHNALSTTSHPLVAMVDADVLAGPDFLRCLLAPLSDPAVGLTTTLYRASPGGSIWSRMDGLWTSTTYLPSALFGRKVIGEGFAFGAAIALSRDVLKRIGGFEAIAPRVGDDYQLGQRTAALGLRVLLLPYVVTEQVEDIGLRDFVSRRARWSRTIHAFQPAGYAGLLFTFSLPLALAAALSSRSKRGWAWAGIAVVNRILCAALNRRHFEPGAPAADLLLLPARDMIAVWVWILGFRLPPTLAPGRPR